MSICSQFYLVYSIFFAISCVKTNKLPFCQIISIYALLAEGDLLEGYGNDNPGAFQSTPSSRRATNQDKLYNLINPISIHALLTEGDVDPVGRQAQLPPISIHALLTEGDFSDYLLDTSIRKFQSTPSSRRATLPIFKSERFAFISIHALLTEGDSFGSGESTVWFHFNPRPPHGGRQQK